MRQSQDTARYQVGSKRAERTKCVSAHAVKHDSCKKEKNQGL